MELYKKSAFQLSELLKKKEITAVELCENIYGRIEKTDDKVDSFITLCREKALKSAALSDAARQKGEASDMSGLPVAVKDNILTKGVLTTCASKMLSNFIPPYNATVCERMEQAGMVVIGKVNLDEFAMGSYCNSSYYKTTKNPHNTEYLSGGSSGGSAACLAAYQTPLALGSDTGGSVRLPASHCGVVGLKPTYGTVSRFGLAAFASSLDQIGPMARDVRDTAMLLDVIAGCDPNDSTSCGSNGGAFSKSLDESKIKGMKIGLPKELFNIGVSEAVTKNVMEAAMMLGKLGAELIDVSLPSSEYTVPAYFVISSAEASSNLARYDGIRYGFRAEEFSDLTDIYIKARTEGFGDEVKRRIMAGTLVLSAGYYDMYYKKARLARHKISAEYKEALNKCDMLLTPAAPASAAKNGQNLGKLTEIYADGLCTVGANLAGLPALSIPCGRDINGMPIGMQLIGRRFRDQDILDAAYAYERARGLDFSAAVKGADI